MDVLYVILEYLIFDDETLESLSRSQNRLKNAINTMIMKKSLNFKCSLVTISSPISSSRIYILGEYNDLDIRSILLRTNFSQIMDFFGIDKYRTITHSEYLHKDLSGFLISSLSIDKCTIYSKDSKRIYRREECLELVKDMKSRIINIQISNSANFRERIDHFLELYDSFEILDNKNRIETFVLSNGFQDNMIPLYILGPKRIKFTKNSYNDDITTYYYCNGITDFENALFDLKGLTIRSTMSPRK